MSILGLGKSKKNKTQTATSSQANEAQAVLAKMEAKKEHGDCAFC